MGLEFVLEQESFMTMQLRETLFGKQDEYMLSVSIAPAGKDYEAQKKVMEQKVAQLTDRKSIRQAMKECLTIAFKPITVFLEKNEINYRPSWLSERVIALDLTKAQVYELAAVRKHIGTLDLSNMGGMSSPQNFSMSGFSAQSFESAESIDEEPKYMRQLASKSSIGGRMNHIGPQLYERDAITEDTLKQFIGGNVTLGRTVRDDQFTYTTDSESGIIRIEETQPELYELVRVKK